MANNEALGERVDHRTITPKQLEEVVVRLENPLLWDVLERLDAPSPPGEAERGSKREPRADG